MVLDFKFLSEEEIICILKTQVPDEKIHKLDYKQILNSAKEIQDNYVIKIEDKTLKINKISGEVL
ncbi:hypothetical protein [Methanobrevibacter woesei]|uniref:hypothetical protein n=1 Tax=Methanobrevibacter woesei TaxID=190976 RepID=UPI0024B71243|nr:hypothetical protein [Methanobrevibacter woesei]